MRGVALLLVPMITAIASVDPLYCADGCTRGDLAATTYCAQHGGDCPICQPGAAAQLAVPSISEERCPCPVFRDPLR